MTTPSICSSSLRSIYENSFARLEHFPALESNWRLLLPRLAEVSSGIRYRNDDSTEGTLSSLWADHVLTVLADIAQLNATADTRNLYNEVGKWITRLDRYIYRNWKTGYGEASASQAARQLKERLEQSLPDQNSTEKRGYYQMLRTLHSIQEHFGYYLAQIESSGDMDGAMSLLLIYLRNYSSIAEVFNRRFATLPELYRHHILHAIPKGTVHDSVYIVVTPAENVTGFTLPEGHPFPAGQNAAGEELTYHTTRAEYITPMQCVGVNAVCLDRIQYITTAETLFAAGHSRPLMLGWQVESSMLVLDEGERNVSLCLRLTADSVMPESLPADSFILQLSSPEGWTEPVRTPHANLAMHIDGVPCLCFDFTIPQEAPGLVPCNEEVHGLTTAYPALRILTGEASRPYDWGTRLKFCAVEIRTKTTGIRNFTFYNELGAVDTSQPFQPFGIEANKDAWFMFGNEEMGLKPLQEVRLKALWKKLPETEAEFDKIYKEYTSEGKTVTVDSFRLATQWQQGGRWHAGTGGEQRLFIPDNGEDRSLTHAEIVIGFTKKVPLACSLAIPYEYSRDRDGFFRASLHAPATGFGMHAYRQLFTETMIHNSHCKEKERKSLPSEPVTPLMADVELSYIASEETALPDIEHSSIRLSRITALSEQETFPIGKEGEQPFLLAIPADKLLYFAFLHAGGEQSMRMYLDMVLPKEKIPFYNPQPGKSVKLAWGYWNGSNWQPIPTDSVIAEETSGLQQSGFVEIKLPEKIRDSYLDKQGRAWLRAAVAGDVSSCLAVRGIHTNCIRLAALNSDGIPLPAGTIQATKETDERIESIAQPLAGFGGRPAETEAEAAVHQSSRMHNRHRAITIKDYEQLVLEHFPEVDKVQCIPVQQKKEASKIALVVFSRTEDSRYCLSPAWKLAEIERLIRQYAPPFISLCAINPVYERVDVRCRAVLWDRVADEGKAIRQLVVLAQNYIAPWYRKREIPTLGRHYSYKELHARMVNHEDLMKLVTLEVDGKSLPHVDVDTEDLIFKGKHPWSILLPNIKIELLSPHGGIDAAEIGANFIIG